MVRTTLYIEQRPPLPAAAALLETAALPVSDLTAAHLEHFFFCGPRAAPMGIVGVELYGSEALLRSLVVAEQVRASGTGSALVAHAERYAHARGVRALFLLTTTAEAFFGRRGYARIERTQVPNRIQATREFADICPASSAVMLKLL